jgi:hypothetical protein
MRCSLALAAIALIAAPASAQAWLPGQTFVGDPLADRLRDRMEIQRLQSAEQAAFARQQQLNSRLTAMEIQAARQPEPYIPLVAVPASPDARRRARDAATARRESVSAGVAQIDEWLARTPR